jgi:hypothetical protein
MSKEIEEGPSMTFQQLKDFILSKITIEVAFDRLLESGLINYRKLRFDKGEEVHPLLVMSMAAMEMGWDFVVENREGKDEVRGLITGTQEYIDDLYKDMKTNHSA